MAFDDKEFLEKRFRDDEHNVGEKRLHRLRVEGTTYRVTWEDTIEGAKKDMNLKVIATLEYTKESGQSKLGLLTMSAEKPQTEAKVETIQEQLVRLAAQRLHMICRAESQGKNLSDADWEQRINHIIGVS